MFWNKLLFRLDQPFEDSILEGLPAVIALVPACKSFFVRRDTDVGWTLIRLPRFIFMIDEHIL